MSRGDRRQRVAVYALCTDPVGRVLLTRASESLTVAGRWFLPGGGLHFGEAPVDGLVRECREETGLEVTVGPILGVLSDTSGLPDGTELHTVRLVYRIATYAGELQAERDGSTDAVEWVARDELSARPVMPYVRTVLDELA